VAGRRAKTYSGGMRRRLDLAASLVGRPRVLYLVLFTYVFGGAVSGSTHKYLQFSLPGVLVMSVVFASMGTGMMLNADITTGVFDRFRSLPIARWAPLAGAILGDAIRYVISIAVTLGFGFVLGFRIEATPLTGGPAAGVVERSLLWTLGIFVVFAPLAVAAYRRRT
jgi:oleandomycin transport system permease protein